jgi:NAD(P)H-dependent flavin oxidoreductase YrpB (nitropropane dioxygenase family)
MHFHTPLTKKLNIEIPIMLVGMTAVLVPDLVVTVSNAGGIGTLGPIGMSPDVLCDCIKRTKKWLNEGKSKKDSPTNLRHGSSFFMWRVCFFLSTPSIYELLK